MLKDHLGATIVMKDHHGETNVTKDHLGKTINCDKTFVITTLVRLA